MKDRNQNHNQAIQNQKILVLAAVIEKEGRFLICQRRDHKRHGGLWEFPGGKVEPEENLLETAQRELAEELGLNVVQIGEIRFAVADPQSNFVINFVDVCINGQPKLLEHKALDWLTVEQLLELQLAPADRLFVEQLTTRETII